MTSVEMENRPLTQREAQALKSKEAILDATIRCLEEFGYAETSTSRITDVAGISRGALTHHFATKEDLIVETTNKILRPTVGQRRLGAADEAAMRNDLRRTWDIFVNRPHGRALVEILVASRTDGALRTRIKDNLIDWNARIEASLLEDYESTKGDDEEVRRIWTIARIFFRGLITHDAFVKRQGEHDELVETFIDLIAPLLKRRQP
jgi:AcrR family transcriptional regulator